MDKPKEVEPSKNWEHRELYKRVKSAIFALQSYFDSDISIKGLDAEDLFSLNSLLGAAIEANVVETLNSMRSVWDPNDRYADCSFTRQSQTFPDILFARHAEGGRSSPIMGIELKGWYLLSKEKEPSFRYKITPDACAPQDLLVVFAWSLDQVLSGEPELYEPYVTSARRASHFVDYYWQELRDTEKDISINRPDGVSPYPASKSDKIQDDPVSDSGNNYGRVARTGMMDDYSKRMMNKELAGIRARDWINFLRNVR
jgi:hypothetical protein